MHIPVIGLEIHVELKTKSKMFCQCEAYYFGKKPNTNTCPVCLGMPGALPVPNRKALEWTAKIGKALGCSISKLTKFDRKHYFYPDLPKAYQISQYDEPVAVNGHVDITAKDGKTVKKFGIRRVHLEEDTGKLMHVGEDTLVDFNRSSVPLVEIVTEPDFDNSEDVKLFLEELHTIIRYLDVSDADMEKGTMRLEPNISLRVITNEELRITKDISSLPLPNYKVEVKNINSFNFAKKAIDFELKRQQEILEKGETPKQETRGYNESKGETYAQRSKEDAHDYRYFPEPDIPPIEFSDDLLSSIEKDLPELPAEKVERFISDFDIKYADAFQLTRNKVQSEFFEKIIIQAIKAANSKGFNEGVGQRAANWIVNKGIDPNISNDEFAKIIIDNMKPKETDMSLLSEVVTSVLAAQEKSVADYKAGKTAAIMFLVGQVMKEMKGQADAATVRSALEEALKS